jgi:hypothetical protein
MSEYSNGQNYIHKEFNPLNAELNPICHLLALLGSATIVVVSRLRVKEGLVPVKYSCHGLRIFYNSVSYLAV